MQQKTREELINKLDDNQAITISKNVTDSLQDKLDDRALPPEEERVKAISIFLEGNTSENLTLDDKELENVSKKQIGDSCREMLVFVSRKGDKEILDELDKKLESPPNDQTAAIPLILAAPLVITGCIVLLNLVSSIKYENGKLTYNPKEGKEVIGLNIDGVVKILDKINIFKSLRKDKDSNKS